MATSQPSLTKDQLLEIVSKASTVWKNAFNSQDAAGCAAQYEANAVMVAKPFGTFTGTAEIQGFWQKLMDDGFSDVDYVAPTVLTPEDDMKSVTLSSNWTMNKAKGVITKELWVVQEDGTAKLAEDHFEATG
eukprot:g8710.t1